MTAEWLSVCTYEGFRLLAVVGSSPRGGESMERAEQSIRGLMSRSAEMTAAAGWQTPWAKMEGTGEAGTGWVGEALAQPRLMTSPQGLRCRGSEMGRCALICTSTHWTLRGPGE